MGFSTFSLDSQAPAASSRPDLPLARLLAVAPQGLHLLAAARPRVPQQPQLPAEVETPLLAPFSRQNTLFGHEKRRSSTQKGRFKHRKAHVEWPKSSRLEFLGLRSATGASLRRSMLLSRILLVHFRPSEALHANELAAQFTAKASKLNRSLPISVM